MNPYMPFTAEIVEKSREANRIYTFRLQFREERLRQSFRFKPGQFNMVYAYGVGEVPVSIVSDPAGPVLLEHTVRVAGNVTEALARLGKGDVVGLRGPYGNGWPLEEAAGKDVILITGGLGCAPVVAVINYIVKRRKSYGSLKILQGIKAPRDLLYRGRIREWRRYPDTEVFLTVDQPDRQWKYRVGVVTNLLGGIFFDPPKTVVMMCGPEGMMHFAVKNLLSRGIQEAQIYLSIERNMKCAVGFCGHCQFGPSFVCKDGPVFRYDRIKTWFNIREI